MVTLKLPCRNPSTFSKTPDMYGLLTKCEVKMAGYWPIKFFFFVFMNRDGVEVHKHAKKNEANIQPSYCMTFGEIFLAGHGG